MNHITLMVSAIKRTLNTLFYKYLNRIKFNYQLEYFMLTKNKIFYSRDLIVYISGYEHQF
jgi:ribosomal protein S17E